MLDAAGAAGRAGLGVRVAPAVLVGVLRDVEKVREVAECAHKVQRLLDRQRVELRLELRLGAFTAPEAHRRLAYRLDTLASLLPHLLRDDLAEQAPEKTAVVS